LNTFFKSTMMTKTQDAVFSYAEMLKMRSNFIIKTVFKQIKQEITILQHECLSFNRKKIKSAKIMKIMNTKMRDNSKKKMITARKLLNENIVLILNSAEIKNHMMKKTDWTAALKLKICIIRTHFTIMIKHVIRDVIDQSNQKTMTTEINTQNFRICRVIKILHVEHSKKSIQDNVKTDILIINMIIFWQTNILI